MPEAMRPSGIILCLGTTCITFPVKCTNRPGHCHEWAQIHPHRCRCQFRTCSTDQWSSFNPITSSRYPLFVNSSGVDMGVGMNGQSPKTSFNTAVPPLGAFGGTTESPLARYQCWSDWRVSNCGGGVWVSQSLSPFSPVIFSHMFRTQIHSHTLKSMAFTSRAPEPSAVYSFLERISYLVCLSSHSSVLESSQVVCSHVVF